MQHITLLLRVQKVSVIKVIDYFAALYNVNAPIRTYKWRNLRIYTAVRYNDMFNFLMFLQGAHIYDGLISTTFGNFRQHKLSELPLRRTTFTNSYLTLLKEEKVRLPRKYGPKFLRKFNKRRGNSLHLLDGVARPLDHSTFSSSRSWLASHIKKGVARDYKIIALYNGSKLLNWNFVLREIFIVPNVSRHLLIFRLQCFHALLKLLTILTLWAQLLHQLQHCVSLMFTNNYAYSSPNR